MVTITDGCWKLENINGVIFDKDGTIIDSHLYWGSIIQKRAERIIKYYSLTQGLFSDLCLKMGYSLDQNKLLPEGPIALVGRDEVICILSTFLNSYQILSAPDELSQIFIDVHTEFKQEAFNYIQILPGVEEFVRKLYSKGIKLAIVTSDSIHLTKLVLRKLNLEKFFDCIVGKESTVETKFTGIPAKVAIREMNLLEEDTICIGDAPVDAIMAKESGLKACIGVVTGQVGRNALEVFSPYIVDRMNKLYVE